MAAATRPALVPTPPARTRQPFQPSPPETQGRFGAVVSKVANILKFGSQGGPFLALLRSEADLVADAALLLAQGTQDATTAREKIVDQVVALGRRARELQNILTSQLCSTPFAPLTQEEIRMLSVSLRKILDNLAVAGATPLHLLGRSETALHEASHACAIAVTCAISALPDGRGLTGHTASISSSARAASRLLRDCETEILIRRADAASVLRRIQAIQAMRSLFRSYRDMARVLERALLRNS